MKKKQTSKKKLNLEDTVKAAQAAGVKVSFSLEDTKMPVRFPCDHPLVLALLNESERLNHLAYNWRECQYPNLVASQKAEEMGWAHALSAAWLRCYLKGELTNGATEKQK